jgi:outer membrane biosynthesis protein TonB
MRHRPRPGKKPLMASAAIHVVVMVLAWWAQASSTPPLQDFVTYQITLVSPPPAQLAEEPQPVPEQEVVVETPEPVVEREPPPVVEERRREEQRPTPTPTPTPTPPEPEPPGDPEPSAEVGGEDLNVRMEGLRRDFPEYYANIITQIRRCMRFRGSGRFETTVFFYIDREGNVDGRDIRFVERSGNVDFDFASMGAVECAGGRFGPLPEELGFDRLPILFTFSPGGGGR